MRNVKKRLGDILHFKRGYDLPEKARTAGPIPVISSAGISGTHSEHKVDGEGVVIGRYGTLGEVFFYDGKYWPHNTALYVEDFKGNNARYIYYLLKCLGNIQTTDKSAVPGVNRNDLHELLIPFTEREEQNKIAAVLSCLDAKIDLNKRVNAELEAMAKTLYDYWFIQFDFPCPRETALAQGKPELEGKPYKSSGGRMVWNTELKREIPEGWEVLPITRFVIFNPTLNLPKGKMASYIDMSALPTDGYMTDLPKTKEFNGGMKFQNGDVVIARITPCLENGKTALISLLNGSEIGFGSTEFIVIRGKEISLSGLVACFARTESFRNYAISNMTGTSGRKRIESTTLGNYVLAKPPSTSLLEIFEERVKPFFNNCTSFAKQNCELQKLRDFLLPMLMNGQVTVE